MMRNLFILAFASLLLCGAPALAQEPAPGYDAALAEKLGADKHGMRSYVFVLLRTGPTRVEDPEARKAMFAGHMANMGRLAEEGKLAFAGPFDGVDGWRGMFVFATDDIEDAKAWVATDPVIVNGEMVAEYHKLYGSAALMMVDELSRKIAIEPL